MDQEMKNEFENLARMVQTGFAETATKKELQTFREEFLEFEDDVNNRFRGVDRKFDEIDIHFQDTTNKIDAVYSEVKDIKISPAAVI